MAARPLPEALSREDIVEAVARALDAAGVRGTARILALHLAEYPVNPEPQEVEPDRWEWAAWISIGKLAERMKLSETAVHDAVRTLVKAGILERKERYTRGGRRTSNWLIFPAIGSAAAHPNSGARTPAVPEGEGEGEDRVWNQDHTSSSFPSSSGASAIWDAILAGIQHDPGAAGLARLNLLHLEQSIGLGIADGALIVGVRDPSAVGRLRLRLLRAVCAASEGSLTDLAFEAVSP
jgi:hypothetical protein